MSVCLIISNSHCYSANTNIHTSEQHMTSSSSTRVQKLRGELFCHLSNLLYLRQTIHKHTTFHLSSANDGQAL